MNRRRPSKGRRISRQQDNSEHIQADVAQQEKGQTRGGLVRRVAVETRVEGSMKPQEESWEDAQGNNDGK